MGDVWVLKLVLTLALPLVAAIILGLVGLVFGALISGSMGWFASKNLAQLKSAYIRAWFQSLVLLYLPLTSAAFSVFGCRRNASQRWVLDADPTRTCFNSAWWAGLFPLGLVAVSVYAIAIPAAVVGILFSRRRSLDPLVFSLKFGFLVGRFLDSAWWFEAAIMARKLLIVVCMTFFFTEAGKANAGVFVLLGCLVQLVFARPYIAQFHNGLAIVVLLSTLRVLYSGTFIDYTFRRVGVITGIVVNVLAIVLGNGWDLWRIAQTEKEIEEDEFFQDGVFHMDAALADESILASGKFSSEVGAFEAPPAADSIELVPVTTSFTSSATNYNSATNFNSANNGTSTNFNSATNFNSINYNSVEPMIPPPPVLSHEFIPSPPSSSSSSSSSYSSSDSSSSCSD